MAKLWDEKWERTFFHLNAKTPTCNEKQDFVGCATNCDFLTCDDFLDDRGRENCNALNDTVATCVCKSGFYLLNGECVSEEECRQDGWREWSEWSQCSDPCKWKAEILSLTDTGENVQKWTRVFFDSALSHTRRSDASEKKKKNTRVHFWTFSPVDKFRVFVCIC